MSEQNQSDEAQKKVLRANFLAEGIPQKHLYRPGSDRQSTEVLEANFVRARDATERDGFLRAYSGLSPTGKYRFLRDMLDLASRYQKMLTDMGPELRETEKMIRGLERKMRKAEANAQGIIGSHPDVIIEQPRSNILPMLITGYAGYRFGKS